MPRRVYSAAARLLDRTLPLLGVVLTVAAFTFSAISLTRSAHQGEEAHQALCQLRADVQNRRDSLVRYIKANPQGIPALGVTRLTLDNQLVQYGRTLRALQKTHC